MLKEIIPEIKDFAVLISNEEIQSQLFYHIDFFCDSIKTIYEVILIKNDAYGFQSGIFMKQQ